MSRSRVIVAVLGLAVFVPEVPEAEAGCICPDLTDIDVGDLRVANATVTSQTWSVSAQRIEAELVLSGVSAATTIDVLVLGAPAAEYRDFLDLAKMNRQPGNEPPVTATVGGVPLPSKLVERDARIRATWTIGDLASGRAKVQLGWDIPAAGADERPVTRSRIAEFCIDAGTQRALAKSDGFHRVDLVLSSAMATDLKLVIRRDTQPVSLCARNVKKKNARTFEIRGRKNLQDRSGVLPILFGATL